MLEGPNGSLGEALQAMEMLLLTPAGVVILRCCKSPKKPQRLKQKEIQRVNLGSLLALNKDDGKVLVTEKIKLAMTLAKCGAV